MPNYWIAVASREHVFRGIKGGFIQVCHGKQGPLKRMKEGDWILYYSPTEQFQKDNPCRRFTAIGRITQEEPYEFHMSENFIPWRRNVIFLDGKELPIVPLIGKLSFISDKQRWGFPFKRGCFSINEKDFQMIAKGMAVNLT